MSNYIVTPTNTPAGFEIRDTNGELIGFAMDEATANVFAHLPELLALMDSCVNVNLPFSYSDAVDLQKKLKKFRK